MKMLRTIALAALVTVSSTASLLACKDKGCEEVDLLAPMSIAQINKLIAPKPCPSIPVVSEVDLFVDSLHSSCKSTSCSSSDCKDYNMSGALELLGFCDAKGAAASLKGLRVEYKTYKKALSFLKEERSNAGCKKSIGHSKTSAENTRILIGYTRTYERTRTSVIRQLSEVFSHDLYKYVGTAYADCHEVKQPCRPIIKPCRPVVKCGC